MVGSIPEKTLEHWASRYLAYRYRTFLGLWWPVDGADIMVEDVHLRIGKSFWLELKTTVVEPASPDKHTLKIDLWQLNNYHDPAAGAPPVYYVFPRPMWAGDIGSTTGLSWLGSTSRTELAHRRAAAKWFGEWTRVVPGWELFQLAQPTIAQHQLAGTLKGATATVGTWDSAHKKWKVSKKFRGLREGWRWPDFWDVMQTCGSDVMPALFAVPGRRNASSTRAKLKTRLDPRDLNGEQIPFTTDVPTAIYLPKFEDGVPSGTYEIRGQGLKLPSDSRNQTGARTLVTMEPPALSKP